jgi:alkyl hydroperoxide reductase subunit AhpC
MNGSATAGPCSSRTPRTSRRSAPPNSARSPALEQQFAQRGAKVIGLSVDPVDSHSKWEQDIEDVGGHKVNYPLIGDPELKIAKLYDMLPADAGETSEGRTPANNAPVRTVFVIGPDKRIKLQIAYPMTTGRNFDE